MHNIIVKFQKGNLDIFTANINKVNIVFVTTTR